jgi:Skp family chaperone for outer membrane proteins
MLELPDLRASLVGRLLDLRHAFHPHVDGRTRVSGVSDFFAAVGVLIDRGTPSSREPKPETEPDMIRSIALCIGLTIGAAGSATAQVQPRQTSPSTPPKVESVQPVTLFPADAKFGIVDFQHVASDSVAGKLARQILDTLHKQKMAELDAQNTQLQALISRRDSQVLTELARAQVEKDVARLQRELQFSGQSAQAEFDQRQTELETDLERQVVPVVSDIAKERGLHAVFLASPQLLYADPRVDITNEVIQRMDTKSKK